MVDAPATADGTRRPIGGYVLSVVAILWALAAVTLLGAIVLEALTSTDAGCEVPLVEPEHGRSEWQWWPPGEVCTFAGDEFSEPSDARGWAIVAEVVIGLGLLVAWRRYRNAPEPDWTA